MITTAKQPAIDITLTGDHEDACEAFEKYLKDQHVALVPVVARGDRDAKAYEATGLPAYILADIANAESAPMSGCHIVVVDEVTVSVSLIERVGDVARFRVEEV